MIYPYLVLRRLQQGFLLEAQQVLSQELQNLLLNSVGKDSQCFISATHLDKFNHSFLGSSQMIHL